MLTFTATHHKSHTVSFEGLATLGMKMFTLWFRLVSVTVKLQALQELTTFVHAAGFIAVQYYVSQ